MPDPDHALAARLAHEAGQLLLATRRELADASRSLLRDEGDRRAHDLLVARLAEARPDDAVLSEEGVDHASRLDSSRIWIVDPLDGTREFGEPPRDDWAVHVALIVGESPVAGAVALPARGLVIDTLDPPPMQPAHTGPPRMVVSRSRATELVRILGERLGADLVPMGSAGAKAMAVVLGDVDIYAHSGGMYEWDSAAPAAVAAAAGLHVSRLDGSPLRYNQPDPWLPDLLICRPELVDAVRSALDGVVPRGG